MGIWCGFYRFLMNENRYRADLQCSNKKPNQTANRLARVSSFFLLKL